MLFNSYLFLLVFLPVTLLVFFQIGRYSQLLAALWLFMMSLFFYGWWNPIYVGLLLGSIVFNYSIGLALSREALPRHSQCKYWMLFIGIVSNIGLLAYYKYANFFVENINTSLQLDWQFTNVMLPLGISFFTFTQIAFLVDAYRGEVKESNFIYYGLFVTYFPHLLAGPVLHHKEMIPQFTLQASYQVDWRNISVGTTIFTMGLFKKVWLADSIAPYANPVFSIAANGGTLTFLEAWGGALAYTFQLYFDFSGYSDMAIGLSRLFGVRLPLNFNSPYKAVNIIDFWRRWHMTLSRFLRDYLYFSLGGNRKGVALRYLNLIVTMVLGGLWHGAGWTFVVWGLLHGVFLVINHAWHQMRKALGHNIEQFTIIGRFTGIALTFFVVVIGWVFFRANSFDAAFSMLEGMFGLNGVILPSSWYGLPHWRVTALLEDFGTQYGVLSAYENLDNAWYWIVALWICVWVAPNTQQIMAAYNPALEKIIHPARYFLFKESRAFALLVGGVLGVSLLSMRRVSEFLYFQF